MHSPDQSDIDPRNPENQEFTGKMYYYICPNQMPDYDTPDAYVDEWIDCYDQALKHAKRIAKVVGHRIAVSEYSECDGYDLELVRKIAVFPWDN